MSERRIGNKVNDEDDEMLARGYSYQCGRAQHHSCAKDDCVCGCHEAERKQAALEARADVAGELAEPIEAMGRRLHIIDHGAILPAFEWCQDMACQARWQFIELASPGRRRRALEEWRDAHPQYPDAGRGLFEALDTARKAGVTP